jgi:hypothetical protein
MNRPQLGSAWLNYIMTGIKRIDIILIGIVNLILYSSCRVWPRDLAGYFNGMVGKMAI